MDPPMVDLPPFAWLTIALLAGGALLGALHVVAARVRDHTLAHDVRFQAIALRTRHLAMIKAMKEYRDLALLPEDLDAQIRYLLHGEYPAQELDDEPVVVASLDEEHEPELAAAA